MYLVCHPGYHTGIGGCHPGYHTGIGGVTLVTIQVYGLSPWLPYMYLVCHPGYHTDIRVVTLVTIHVSCLSSWLPYGSTLVTIHVSCLSPWLPYGSTLVTIQVHPGYRYHTGEYRETTTLHPGGGAGGAPL